MQGADVEECPHTLFAPVGHDPAFLPREQGMAVAAPVTPRHDARLGRQRSVQFFPDGRFEGKHLIAWRGSFLEEVNDVPPVLASVGPLLSHEQVAYILDGVVIRSPRRIALREVGYYKIQHRRPGMQFDRAEFGDVLGPRRCRGSRCHACTTAARVDKRAGLNTGSR